MVSSHSQQEMNTLFKIKFKKITFPAGKAAQHSLGTVGPKFLAPHWEVRSPGRRKAEAANLPPPLLSSRVQAPYPRKCLHGFYPIPLIFRLELLCVCLSQAPADVQSHAILPGIICHHPPQGR